MKTSVRLIISLSILFVVTLSGFTCSKQVPVNEPPQQEELTDDSAGSSESADGASKTSENEDAVVPQEGMPEATEAEHSDSN